MKRFTKLFLGLAAIALGLTFSASVRAEETIKKLHTSPQRIINSTTFNDSNEPTSNTVDLAGGDYQKCSFAVYSTSSTGSTTLSLAVQVSPDGGSTWIATGDTITVATGTASAVHDTTANIATGPGTKLRLVPTLTGSTTFYNFKVWAMPSVD